MAAKSVSENLPAPDTDHAGEGSPASIAPSADVITETEAYQRFGHLLEDKELRVARQEGRLGYLRRKRTIFYRLSELQAFLDDALESEYVRAPRPIKKRPSPAPREAFKASPPSTQSPSTSSKTDAALTRLARKIARVEGRA